MDKYAIFALKESKTKHIGILLYQVLFSEFCGKSACPTCLVKNRMDPVKKDKFHK